MNNSPVSKLVRSSLLATLLLGCLALFIWSFVIEPNSLTVKKYQLTIPNWPTSLNGFTIAVITDLHVGSCYIDLNKVKEVVSATNNAQPDLILLLGDYVTTFRGRCQFAPSEFAPELAKLKAKYGVYAVLGNHDWWYDGDGIMKAFSAVHLKVLENSAAEIKVGDDHFWVVGLADLWTRKQSIPQVFSRIPNGDPIVVMTHNPDLFPSIPDRASLTLAGHTHGGQIAFLGAFLAPSQYGARYARGHVIENGRHLFVATGIGTTFLPVRFLIPPEISLVVLNH